MDEKIKKQMAEFANQLLGAEQIIKDFVEFLVIDCDFMGRDSISKDEIEEYIDENYNLSGE